VAHHKSARKRIRRNNRANERNSQYLASVRTAIKKLRVAVAGIAEGSAAKGDLGPLFVAAQGKIAKAAAKGILHKNNASRRIGRLAALLKSADNVTAAPAGTKTAGKKTGAAKKPAAAKKAAAPKKK
jgi:small subunit ribosomal protein S20